MPRSLLLTPAEREWLASHQTLRVAMEEDWHPIEFMDSEGTYNGIGMNREDLVAAIGPGIGPDSFEVGPEVLGLFPEEFHATTRRGTPSVDLPAMLRRQLSDSGIADSAIRTSPIDTFASADWHSHRRGRESAGRNGSLCIVLPATPPIARS